MEGVVFDVGGVLTQSPVPHLARYAVERGVSPKALGRALGKSKVWEAVERGELKMYPDGVDQLGIELSAALETEVDAGEVIDTILGALRVRKEMVAVVRRLLDETEVVVGILTNNWEETQVGDGSLLLQVDDDDWVTPYIESGRLVVMESWKIGMRKPEREIYKAMTTALGVSSPSRVVFLDDLSANIRAARSHGWHAIHVLHSPPHAYRQAVRSLLTVLGMGGSSKL